MTREKVAVLESLHNVHYEISQKGHRAWDKLGMGVKTMLRCKDSTTVTANSPKHHALEGKCMLFFCTNMGMIRLEVIVCVIKEKGIHTALHIPELTPWTSHMLTM